MLIRYNYYEEKREEIKALVIQVIHDLMEMTNFYIDYLNNPSAENRDFILKNEYDVDRNEEKIENVIQEIISLEHLDTKEIKWLFSMNRIIRDLERVGDQLVNIITLSDVSDTAVLKPMIGEFFFYEQNMMKWLAHGIEYDKSVKLEAVIVQDKHVNQLNKDTYRRLVTLINDYKNITESKLKMIIISRFLERIGDHLVNVARTYKDIVEQNR